MRKNLGFTLLELMVGIAVAAIVASLAVPSFNRLIASSRLNAQTTELLSALQYARAEALVRNLNVSICHTADPTASTPACGSTENGWDTGWIVFTDTDTGGTTDGTDQVLRVGQPAKTMTFNVPEQYNKWLGFSATGLPRAAGSGLAGGTIIVCNGSLRRAIVISSTGRITLNDKVSENASCGADL
jgi:type IV fimbrial biogenesis protein FimT